MITLNYMKQNGKGASIRGTRGKLRVMIETLDVTQRERVRLHKKLSTLKTPLTKHGGRRRVRQENIINRIGMI